MKDLATQVTLKTTGNYVHKNPKNYVVLIPFYVITYSNLSKFCDGKLAQRKLCQSYLLVVNSKTNKMAELDLDSKKMFWLVNSHQSPSKFFLEKIGWVSIPSKSVKVHQSSLTKLLMQVYRSKNFVKENFDQVFDGRLWSCKRAFILSDETYRYTPVGIWPCNVIHVLNSKDKMVKYLYFFWRK